MLLLLVPRVEHPFQVHFSLWFALGSKVKLALNLLVVQSLGLKCPPPLKPVRSLSNCAVQLLYTLQSPDKYCLYSEHCIQVEAMPPPPTA